jgi:hypothetical protein
MDDLRPRRPTDAESSPAEVASSLAELALRFPGVLMWYGEHTRRFWAMVGGDLFEAPTAEILTHEITGTQAPPRH